MTESRSALAVERVFQQPVRAFWHWPPSRAAPARFGTNVGWSEL